MTKINTESKMLDDELDKIVQNWRKLYATSAGVCLLRILYEDAAIVRAVILICHYKIPLIHVSELLWHMDVVEKFSKALIKAGVPAEKDSAIDQMYGRGPN